MGLEAILFLMFALLAIAFAFGMLTSKNAVHSALFLVGNFGSVAFLYMMLNAPFISMVQIAVYAGAIMVLFLFVIMLLGAEQTSDTAIRRFRWLNGSGTVVALLLLGIFGFLLILPGFTLPTESRVAPYVRIAHAAQAPSLKLTLTGAGAPLEYTLGFGAATEFAAVPAGDYSVSIVRADDNSIAARPTTITLAEGQQVNLVLSGKLDLTTSNLVELQSLSSNLAAVGDDAGRFLIYNGYVARPLMLVDLGPDQVLNSMTRDDELVVLDNVIARDITYRGALVTGEYQEGTYTLAFIAQPVPDDLTTPTVDEEDTSLDTILRLDNYTITADTEKLALLVGDGAQPVPDVDTATDGAQPPAGWLPRPTVLQGMVDDTHPTFGSPLGIGRLLFTDYLLPMNLVGLLLLVALVGVIMFNRPYGEQQERRSNIRRKVSRPLVNVIADQTGQDVTIETPKLGTGQE
jgi:NADH-quinone oxidoreductase subunit J